MPTLTADELQRYGRQILLPEVGGRGQAKLREASVLVLGAGGLGSPAALYLAAAGIGRLGIADADSVDLTNLHRQILHGTSDVGTRKVRSAQVRLSAINPRLVSDALDVRVTAENAASVIAPYDVVVDGTDNFATRYLVNDACFFAHKPLVHAAVLRFFGQITTILPGRSACYRCLFREPPPPGSVPSCAQAGILGPASGLLGVLQAAEALKIVLGAGDLLADRLLTCDLLTMRFHEVRLRRDPECPLCGAHPTITGLSAGRAEYCAPAEESAAGRRPTAT